ncbi:MAG: hypothetical protein AB1646_09685 [Thermodesulfobacteriota bacterium]
MLPGYAKKTNIGIGVAIFMWVAAYFLEQDFGQTAKGSLKLLTLAALVPFLFGCCTYAKGKGYHSAWGFLGLFWCFGLLALVLFPDRHRQVRGAKSARLQAPAEGTQHTNPPVISPGRK